MRNMNNKEINELYNKAIELWGIESQVKMGIEEASELIQALCKMMRGPNERRYQNLCEEIADLEIVMDQIKKIYNIDEKLVNKFKEEKLEKFKNKIEKD